VSSQVPSVAVPDIGDSIVDFVDYVDRSGYFEIISLSNEDMDRSKYYEENKKRTKEQVAFKTYDEFLASLEMKAEIKRFSPIYLERITQLTNKTNQL